MDTVVAKVQASSKVSQLKNLVDQTDKKVLTQTKADLDQLLASEPDLSNSPECGGLSSSQRGGSTPNAKAASC